MALDKKTLGNAFNQIAYGEVMKAAARDYVKEMADEEEASRPKQMEQVDIDDLLDDPELQRLHADRIAAMKQEAEKRAELERKGHGTYTEIEEGEFLEVVTKTDRVVVHFFHKEFERCKIVDKHLAALAQKHLQSRFVKISAPDSPFFAAKLGIKVLPAVVMFKDGVAVGRIVGFEAFGGRDDFGTGTLAARLREQGMLEVEKKPQRDYGGGLGEEDSEEEEEQHISSIRHGFHSSARRSADDESSDFDD